MTRRASRTLFGILSITTVVGISAYAIAHRTKHAQAAADTKPAVQQPTVLAAEVTTPTTRPSGVESAPIPTHVTLGSPAEVKTDVRLASEVVKPASAVIQNVNAIAEGKAKIATGDVLAGRKVLNEALVDGKLSESDAETAKKLISDLNKDILFSTKRFSEDSWQGTHTVASGERLAKIAFAESLTPEFMLKLNGISDARRLRAGATIKTIQGPFHLVITKHTFTMDVYLGSPGEKGALYVESFKVGLGQQNSTPTGTWVVSDRVPNPKYYSPRGEGTVEAGDPKNPLGKYWVALTGTDGNAVGKMSYGIHGTIDPDSIGKMASMGCIRLHNEDIAQVFDMVVKDKTTVVVRD